MPCFCDQGPYTIQWILGPGAHARQHESTCILAVPLNNSSSASFQACKESGRVKQAYRKQRNATGQKQRVLSKPTNEFRMEPDLQRKRVEGCRGTSRGEPAFHAHSHLLQVPRFEVSRLLPRRRARLAVHLHACTHFLSLVEALLFL